MSGGRIALLVAGSIVALAGLAALAGGIALIAVNESERDSTGFFSTAAETFRTDSHALASDELDIGTDGPNWLFEEGRLATVRVRGTSADPDGEIFIGIGPTSRVREYLDGTDHDVVTDLELDPFRATYRPSSGTAAPADPTSETFWSASAEGTGSQTVEWEVAEGNWSVVVMNADASPGVEAQVSLGAKVGFVFWVGLGLVIGGAILLAGGGTMIYFGGRRPKPTAPTGTPAAP